MKTAPDCTRSWGSTPAPHRFRAAASKRRWEMALVDHIDWSDLDILVAAQQRNRSAHAPVISLFRWWARRPHCFAGAVLDSARKEFNRQSFLVADPFSGGGTVAFEAVRRGLPIYAQDLYPWPSQGLATALTAADPHEFKDAAAALLETLKPHRTGYWTTKSTETWEASHIIRARTTDCPDCSKPLFLFRDGFISLASRRANESFAFFGCSACGSVSRRKRDIRSFRCDRCRHRSHVTRQRTSSGPPQILCPHCRESSPLSYLLQSTPDWTPVLIREHRVSNERSARLRGIETGDPVEDLSRVSARRLRIRIPKGLETTGLKRHGFRFWDEIYTERQLVIIRSALAEVSKLKTSRPVREHLRLAVLGSAEMAGYLCRWERFNPKAIEAIANHHFSRSTVTVETNLLSTSGRGTLPRRFEATERALRWMQSQGYPSQTTHAQSSSRRRLVNGALVVTGSSERQLLRNGSAQLVFTDPPYHDDLQYGELSRLFHTWMAQAGQCHGLVEANEAVPNATRGATTQHYEDKVAACLEESRRALSANGRLLLTFHNKDMKAWSALARALLRASFDVVGLAVVTAENSADHSKRGRESFLSDLVIECRPKRKTRRRTWNIEVQGVKRNPERQNLEAIGLALAECVNRGNGEIETLFGDNIRRLQIDKIFIRHGGR
jgi:putative DNA methylase